MGLLDWLTEGIGSDGGNSMKIPPTMLSGTPPPQMTGNDVPPLPDPMKSDIGGGMQGAGPQPYPQGSDPMTAGGTQFPPGADPMSAGGTPPNGPGLPYPPGGDPMTAGGPPPMTPPPPVPLPMARPPGAGAGSPALPPNAMPTSGTGPAPPGPPTSLLPPNAAPSLVPGGGATGPLGRMLGLDRNRESTMRGSLGAGLKAAGENVHKPGLAAFAGSLGSGIEGGKGADDKTIDQQAKYLTQAIADAKAGNERGLNLARTKLALAQAKAAEEGDPEKAALTVARTREATARARKLEEGGGKASVVNSPEQLYLRAIGATNSDGKLSLLKNAYIQASKDGQQDTPAAKAAKTAYETAYDQTRDAHLQTLGVDPKTASKIGKQAGFSADNPIPSAGLTKEKFDQLPPGSYFVNPKDGRLLIKQPPAGANPPAAAQSPAPAAAPVPVTAPAGSAADQDDD